MDTEDLKKQVARIGVPAIAKATKIARTTLYSWLANPDQNLGAKRHALVMDAVRKGSTPTDDAVEHQGELFLPIPVYDIRASAGAGAFVEDGEPTSHQMFGQQWLGSLTTSPISMLSIIRVAGDSMENTLRPGDQILVDRTSSQFAGDGIYVFLRNDILHVKRLQHDDDGGLVILSDNPKYKAVKPHKADTLHIIGLVLWMGRKLV
jgi:phage repressor protein C with HTH and peptisase S24 domain